MVLNKQKGNMYGFVTHTWNPIKGECSHDCVYCYMKVWKQKPIRLVESELKDDLGSGNFIFVGSSTDMFAEEVSREWIAKVLKYCNKFKNKYLFQTKNPLNLWSFLTIIPKDSIVATTIETNRAGFNYNAPSVTERQEMIINNSFKVMITIEPIMDFDLEPFIKMIKEIKPFQVAIGADSKNHKLPEPSKEKVEALIKELEKFTKVIQKDNLKRLIFSKGDKANV